MAFSNREKNGPADAGAVTALTASTAMAAQAVAMRTERGNHPFRSSQATPDTIPMPATMSMTANSGSA